MSSWVVRLLLVLGALAAARVRLGGAEGDPLPTSLVDLVWNSPISSLDDLKHLLKEEAGDLTEGEGEEQEQEQEHASDPHPGRFTRSLIEAQQALLAECKVRTEVQEVTRAMLDRRNANFMLWPPCVEVQRCSGCCNTQLLHCVPTVTSTRYLQVIKIQFLNRKPHYENAIISVEDHLTCRCQSSRSVVHPRTPPQLSPHLPPAQPHPLPQPYPQPRPVHPVTPPKSHTSKAELHRHDDQKHNQQSYQAGEEQWQQGSYTQLARWTPGPGAHHTPPAYTLAAGANAGTRDGQAGGGWTPAGAGAEIRQGPQDRGAPQGSGSEGGAREDVGSQQQHPPLPRHPHHHHPHPHPHPQYRQEPEHSTQYKINSFQSDAASTPPGNITHPASHKPEWNPTPSVAPANQKDPALWEVTSGEHVRVNNDRQTETGSANHRKGSDKEEESGSANSGEGVTVPANQQDKDSGLTNGRRPFSEEERRQRLLETVQKEPHPPHPHSSDHLPQHRPKPTASKAAISLEGPTGRPPSPAVRTPRRPVGQRRRRKHRTRISKTAIRAIIM